MGIRETVNQNPAITTGATALIILAALGMIIYNVVGGGGGMSTGTPQAFYTVDDGKSWFADHVNKFAPFDKDGKTAYQVRVYTCNGGKTKFAGYMLRYTPEAKKRLDEGRDKGRSPDGGGLEQITPASIEVKAPLTGDDPKSWIKQTDPAATKIVNPICKDGKQEDLIEVVP